MSISSLGFPSQAMAEASANMIGRRGLLRSLAAIVLLVAIGILTVSSVLASGDRSSVARLRYAAPGSHSGPIDPHC
jgi:hypothetical protein